MLYRREAGAALEKALQLLHPGPWFKNLSLKNNYKTHLKFFQLQTGL